MLQDTVLKCHKWPFWDVAGHDLKMSKMINLRDVAGHDLKMSKMINLRDVAGHGLKMS